MNLRKYLAIEIGSTIVVLLTVLGLAWRGGADMQRLTDKEDSTLAMVMRLQTMFDQKVLGLPDRYSYTVPLNLPVCIGNPLERETL